MIETVARESEAIAEKHSFGRFADTRRLKWAAGLIGVPLLMAAVMILLYGPSLLKVLLQRQLLASVEIPRFNQLENTRRRLWPAGDEVTVEYVVSGKIKETETGRAAGQAGRTAGRRVQARIRGPDRRRPHVLRRPHPALVGQLQHRAWVGDGRSKQA